MKKSYAAMMATLALPFAMSAVEYAPTAPENVVYQTCTIINRTHPETKEELRVSTDYGFVSFNASLTYADGHEGLVPKANLEYRILVDSDDNPFIFQAPDYIKWGQNGWEPMEWFADSFMDAWDFTSMDMSTADVPTFHKIYLYKLPADTKRVGVQTRFTRGTKVYESEIAWSEPTTPDLTGTITQAQYDRIVNGEPEPEPEPEITQYTPASPVGVVYNKTFLMPRKHPDTNEELLVQAPYGYVAFTLPINYYEENTNLIPKANLSFRVLVNDAANPFIFQGPDYIKWDQNGYEPMEWVSDQFSDAWDFTCTDQGSKDVATYHKVYLYNVPADATRVGVQSRFTRGKNDYDSPISWVEPTTPDLTGSITWEEYEGILAGVEEINAEGVAVEYFDLQGRKVAGTEKGVLVRKATMSDGSVKVQKVVK